MREEWDPPSSSINILDKLDEMRGNLLTAWEVSRENTAKSQNIMKERFDKKCEKRYFEVGDLVLALLPKSGSIFQRKFSVPYKILNKKGDVNYQTETADPGEKI